MESFKSIRTGVIGVGSMGQNHARVYSDISNLVAIADPNEVQGRKVAESLGAIWYSDYHEMLADVDAVTIAVPTVLHREVAETVIKKGVHLLVEKPLAGNVKDAKAIVALAKVANVTLAVGHIERHNPVVAYAKNAIVNGEWGEVISMSARRVSDFPKRISDVGVVFDMAIHDIDILRYLSGGEIVSVYASGGSFMNNENEDHIGILMKFTSGIDCICETSWLTPMKVRQLALTCSTHYVEIDFITQSIEISTSDFVDLDERNLFSSTLEIDKNKVNLTKQEPLKNELLDFLNAIVMNTKPLVSGEEGVAVVNIAEFALESLASGNSIVGEK